MLYTAKYRLFTQEDSEEVKIRSSTGRPDLPKNITVSRTDLREVPTFGALGQQHAECRSGRTAETEEEEGLSVEIIPFRPGETSRDKDPPSSSPARRRNSSQKGLALPTLGPKDTKLLSRNN